MRARAARRQAPRQSGSSADRGLAEISLGMGTYVPGGSQSADSPQEVRARATMRRHQPPPITAKDASQSDYIKRPRWPAGCRGKFRFNVEPAEEDR